MCLRRLTHTQRHSRTHWFKVSVSRVSKSVHSATLWLWTLHSEEESSVRQALGQEHSGIGLLPLRNYGYLWFGTNPPWGWGGGGKKLAAQLIFEYLLVALSKISG